MELDVEVFRQGERIMRVAINHSELTIGRSTFNHLVLPDPSVSKTHARLHFHNNHLILTDLDSTRGTFVAGQKIRDIVLRAGEEFQIGTFTLRIVRRGEGEGLPAAPLPHSGDTAARAAQGQDAHGFINLIQGLLDLTAVVGVTDLKAVLETLLEQTMRLVGARSGFVVLSSGHGLSPVLTRHGSPTTTGERFSRTVCFRAMEQRTTVRLSSVDDLAQLTAIQSLVDNRPALVLAVPLLDMETVYGVLYLEGDHPLPGLFDEQPQLLQDVSTLGGRALRVSLEQRQIVSEKERWRWLLTLSSDEPDLVRTSTSPLMQHVMKLVRRVADEDITALILGESGTGKEVTARTVHKLSSRREGPFTAVNCGALPRDLIEAELFGYEKGAFTGAETRRLGRMELARGGTLLLDEIGEMPRDLQVKLLRVLETRTFERLGGNETIRLDARILAATNRRLDEAVGRGEFREDLYYRLNVVEIRLPPLRDRREDIEPLIHELLLSTNRRFKRKLYGIAPEALSALQSYTWPGNVRELRNVIERAFILETSDRITPASLPFQAGAGATTATAGSPPVQTLEAPMPTLADYVTRQERQYIRLVLQRLHGNVTQAARVLGMNRTALHRKLRQLGLESGD